MNNLEEFLKERQQGIGGSDVAAILGLSKWKTPLQVWQDKINPIVIDENKEINNMMIGSMLESTVLDLYEYKMNSQLDIKPVTVIHSDKMENQGFFKSKKYPWLLAHLDGLATSADIYRVVEAKTTGFYSNEWGDQGTDQIPVQYKLQVALYCLVMAELHKVPYIEADIAVLGSTHDFRVYHYDRDLALEEEIITKTHDFWHNFVLTKQAPPATTQDDINNLYRIATKDKIILADTVTSNATYDLKELKQQIKDLEARKERLENQIKLYMKDSETLIDTDGVKLASWKNQSAIRLDTKRLKEENMALYQTYSKESESRVFRL